MKILVAPKAGMKNLESIPPIDQICLVSGGGCSKYNSCVVCRPYGPCAPSIYED